MTLKEFTESTWFKLLARGAMLVATVFSGYVGVRLALYESRIVTVEQLVASIQSVQSSRAVDNERFQTDMLSFKVTSLASDKDLEFQLIEQGKDIATMTGILQEMQRRALSMR